MPILRGDDALFAITAISYQVLLLGFFALRKFRFDLAIKLGPLFYALGFVAAATSVILVLHRQPWHFWAGGFLFLAWAIFGYLVEYRFCIEWRDPVVWPVFAPYVLLYLATTMFYWWPLALLARPLWYVGAALFVAGTYLNVASHQ